MGTSPSEDDPARRAWRAMRTFVLERNDRRAAVSARLGMSFVRVKALIHLADAPMTLRDLAASLAVDAPYTTVVVDDLEARGLVERRPDPHDRRCKVVVVTTEGRRLARRAGRLLDEPPPALAALPADDLAHLAHTVQALLTADESAATDPPAAPRP